MTLWRDEQDAENWWCHVRAQSQDDDSELAHLFFDVAFRQRHPCAPEGRFDGFPNATEFAWALAQSYTSTNWPCEREDRAFWVAAFHSVGFLDDGMQRPESRPAEPLLLHRAAGIYDLDHAPGLSWTTSRPLAEWFARYNDAHGHRSYVFSAEVPPEMLLARCSTAVAQADAGTPPPGDQWLAEVLPSMLR